MKKFRHLEPPPCHFASTRSKVATAAPRSGFRCSERRADDDALQSTQRLQVVARAETALVAAALFFVLQLVANRFREHDLGRMAYAS